MVYSCAVSKVNEPHSQSKIRGHSATTDHGHSYTASLNAEYTLDVWGKNRADVHARRLEYLAALQDLEDGALSLSTDIADAWVDILSVRTRMKVLEQQIEANRMTLKSRNCVLSTAMPRHWTCPSSGRFWLRCVGHAVA